MTKEVRTRSDVVEHIKWIDAFPPTALCVKVVDALDLHGTMAPHLVDALKTRRVLLAVNKADLLPVSLTAHELQIYARKVANDVGVRNVVGCVATSALRGAHGTTELTKTMKQLRQGRSVYMVGVTNVGKSTLFNSLKKPGVVTHTEIMSNEIATVSSLPGTTMSPLKVRFGKGSDRWDMHDTPGIVVNREKHDMLSDLLLRKDLLQGKTIKPKVFSAQGKRSLFFGGMFRLDLTFNEKDIDGREYNDRTPPRLLLIWNGHLSTHATGTRNAAELMEKKGGTPLLSPVLREIESDGMGTTAPLRQLECLLEDNVWDVASFDMQETYEATSFRVSSRKSKRGQRQRTPLFDIDLGGFGWITVATSYDDYMSMDKRISLLQRANICIWGHKFLPVVVREPLMPSQAGALRSKKWTTL